MLTGVDPSANPSFDDLQRRFSSYSITPDEIAIYGGDMLHMDEDQIREILDKLRGWATEKMGSLPSLRISASPRSITREKLLLLKGYNVKTVEVGAVSTNEDVLETSLRGYVPEQVIESVQLAKNMGFETGAQFITGLPGDSIGRFQKTLADVLSLEPHFSLLYPLIVLRGTRLEEDYLKNRFIPHSESHILKTAAFFIVTCMRWNVKVARIGLFDMDIKNSDIIYNSFSGNLRQRAEGLTYRLMVEYLISRNKNIISLIFNKGWETSVRGKKGENLSSILVLFPHLSGSISFDSHVDGVVGFDNDGREHSILRVIPDFFDFAICKLMENVKS
jgi:histone acetyltransferase (RNA polymerase elongator complex component)